MLDELERAMRRSSIRSRGCGAPTGSSRRSSSASSSPSGPPTTCCVRPPSRASTDRQGTRHRPARARGPTAGRRRVPNGRWRMDRSGPPRPTTRSRRSTRSSRRGSGRSAAHEIRVTNLEKVLFPAATAGEPVTKRDLFRYHGRRADARPVPRDRGLTVQRFPNGIEQKGFWQKDLPSHAPDWVKRWTFHHREEGPKDYPVVDSAATLLWLAQEAAIELHPWTSPIDAPDRRRTPSSTSTLARTRRGTRSSSSRGLYRTALEHLGVRGHPKVTGKRGIQVWIGIAPGYDLRRHARLGRGPLAGGRLGPSRTSSAGSGRSARGRARPASTTPRTRSTRRSSLRTARVRRPARRSACRSTGMSSTIPSCARTDGRSATRWTAWPRRRPLRRRARRSPGPAAARWGAGRRRRAADGGPGWAYHGRPMIDPLLTVTPDPREDRRRPRLQRLPRGGPAHPRPRRRRAALPLRDRARGSARAAEDDLVVEADGLSVAVDPPAPADLAGATVDLDATITGGGLRIDNPNEGWQDPVARAVQDVLDRQINPGVGSHGGMVTLVEVKDGTAYMRFGGGARAAPRSTSRSSTASRPPSARPSRQSGHRRRHRSRGRRKPLLPARALARARRHPRALSWTTPPSGGSAGSRRRRSRPSRSWRG